jgi:hypothetical protein
MKAVAVENFLGSLDLHLNKTFHIYNAISDSISYGWDKETLQHILRGIDKAYQNKKA